MRLFPGQCAWSTKRSEHNTHTHISAHTHTHTHTHTHARAHAHTHTHAHTHNTHTQHTHARALGTFSARPSFVKSTNIETDSCGSIHRGYSKSDQTPVIHDLSLHRPETAVNNIGYHALGGGVNGWTWSVGCWTQAVYITLVSRVKRLLQL